MIVIDEAKTMDLVVAAVKSAIEGEDVVIVINGMRVALVPMVEFEEARKQEDQEDISQAEIVLADPTRWVSREDAKRIFEAR